MSFSPQRLRQRLAGLDAGDAGRYVVAFSGGLDSSVLLHSLCHSGVDVPVSAIHVNHGLQADANLWQAHCEAFCRELGVDLDTVAVTVAVDEGRGPEAAAREARYAVFEKRLESHDVLLSAHHREDQAETLLLNLLRSAGPLGLSGIPEARPVGRARLLRPLLTVSRDELRAYADAQGLHWIEDSSNGSTEFDRNYLRHEILPKLDHRWSDASGRLSRSAGWLAEASGLLDDLADEDLDGIDPARIPVHRFTSLSDARARNLLRFAMRRIGLPLPPAKVLRRVLDELVPAREDAEPLVNWHGGEARRYRECVHLLRPLDVVTAPDATLDSDGRLDLGELGRLTTASGAATGLSERAFEHGLKVRFRVGGERLRPVGSSHTRPLKKLCQEAGILPWMRDRLPLLYHGDELVAVADLWVDAASAAEPGIGIRWENRPEID